MCRIQESQVPNLFLCWFHSFLSWCALCVLCACVNCMINTDSIPVDPVINIQREICMCVLSFFFLFSIISSYSTAPYQSTVRLFCTVKSEPSIYLFVFLSSQSVLFWRLDTMSPQRPLLLYKWRKTLVVVLLVFAFVLLCLFVWLV